MIQKIRIKDLIIIIKIILIIIIIIIIITITGDAFAAAKSVLNGS